MSARLGGVADVVRWLMFMYQVPSEPSRLRTAVWRRLKALGAVYAAHSVAVLPESPEAERALRALRAEVGQMGGTAQLVRAEPLLGQADFTARYNQARDEEYAEVIRPLPGLPRRDRQGDRRRALQLRGAGGKRRGPRQAADLARQGGGP